MKTMYYKVKNFINGKDDSLDAFWEFAAHKTTDREEVNAVIEQIEADLTLGGINEYGWVTNVPFIPRWAFWRKV